jgi:polyribonucleotide nucleotidyltransferase
MAEAEVSLDGRRLSIEAGTLAKQADGAVCVRIGDTITLVTAVAAAPREGIDFFPLTVDYEERMYAAGKIPSMRYVRREGRPGENAILSARRIDRPLRPLFPKGLRNEVQIIVTVLSADQENPPDVAALVGASAALSISSIPFNGPVGGLRVARVGEQFVLNPTFAEREQSSLDLIVVGTREGIVMLEGAADSMPEETLVQALEFAQPHVAALIAAQEELAHREGKPKLEFTPPQVGEDVAQAAGPLAPRLREALLHPDKLARESATGELLPELGASLLEQFPGRAAEIEAALEDLLLRQFRALVLEEGKRPDGRGPEEIRPISCAVGVLPRAHGSALFTRGQTQIMTVATLGGVGEEQLIDDLGLVESKRFIHHYNFPPYSVGEVRPMRGPSRRDIGHGNLAERALVSVLPGEEEFPYTIRVVSEVLESNGSSSMASVCGASLALMDGGVPIRSALAGISVGMVSENGRYRLLTDIQGIEDGSGDMDFKIAGTRQGVASFQMDVKQRGVSLGVIAEALQQAKRARHAILDQMDQCLAAPRPELSPHAPRIFVIEIPPDKIGDVIGPGGKTIKKLEADYDVSIDIRQDGRVFITGTDAALASQAAKTVEEITRELRVGETYTGKVTRVAPFGAIVELLPGKDGLVHISELARERVERVEDVVNVGDEVTVKVIEVEPGGKVRLSRRELLAPVPGEPERRPSTGRRPPPRGRPRYSGR